jgi:hypothetical protein
MAPRTSEENGYEWYDQDIANSPGSKFFCDGKGWLAHVTSDNILFIKKFEDIAASKFAPSEAEVEVYTAPDDSYSELEDQGAYVSIAGKDSITWKVKWYARLLPASIAVNIGSIGLTNYIESILAIDKPSAIVHLNNNSSVFHLYPNPASEMLSVESEPGSFNQVSLIIYNLQGKVVLTKAIARGKANIDIKQLAVGYYVYEIRNGTVSISKGQLSVIR